MATGDEIAAYLAAQGLGTVGTDIFVNFLPETPDNCLAIFEYIGGPGTYVYGPTRIPIIEKPRIQVMTRNTYSNTARAKCESAYTTLDAIVQQTLSGILYYYCAALQPPFFLNLDVNNRYRWAVNFEAWKAVS